MLPDLLELSPGGLEETDLPDGAVEFAIYGASGELPSLGKVQAAVGDALVEVIAQEVAEGWDTRWREFHRPVRIGEEATVRPPWEAAANTPIDVVIDPGQAFGTGAHPSTRQCLELLLGLEPSGALLDLGCGSGVLAIAAAQLGFDPVIALDNDPAAIDATQANAGLNRAQIEVRRHDLRRDPVAAAETTVANLLAPLLITWAGRLGEAPEPPRRLVVGGLLPSDRGTVSEAFAIHGLKELDRRGSPDWMALLLGSGA